MLSPGPYSTLFYCPLRLMPDDVLVWRARNGSEIAEPQNFTGLDRMDANQGTSGPDNVKTVLASNAISHYQHFAISVSCAITCHTYATLPTPFLPSTSWKNSSYNTSLWREESHAQTPYKVLLNLFFQPISNDSLLVRYTLILFDTYYLSVLWQA